MVEPLADAPVMPAPLLVTATAPPVSLVKVTAPAARTRMEFVPRTVPSVAVPLVADTSTTAAVTLGRLSEGAVPTNRAAVTLAKRDAPGVEKPTLPVVVTVPRSIDYPLSVAPAPVMLPPERLPLALVRVTAPPLS